MQIVSIGDSLHEMSKSVFLEKQRKIFQYVICWKFYPECNVLTLKAPCKILADNILLFSEKKSQYFVWTVCLADNSHEMWSLIFFEKKIRMSSAAIMTGTAIFQNSIGLLQNDPDKNSQYVHV